MPVHVAPSCIVTGLVLMLFLCLNLDANAQKADAVTDTKGGTNPTYTATGALGAPDAPAGTTATTATFSDAPGSAIPDAPGGPLVEVISVITADTYLLDVDLTTHITHTFNADLDITLTSPAGTVVTVTTDNGSFFDNVFNGTLWDDDAPTPASDFTYADFTTATPLVPEGAFGAFVGENPNGNWTLTITDDTSNDTGTLSFWALDVTTLDATPSETTTNVATNVTAPILDFPAPPLVYERRVDGLDTYLLDVDLTTHIMHTFNADLDITLTSPAGTVVTVSTDNGGAFDNTFDGTVWDDSNPIPATDESYALAQTKVLVPSPALAPEAAFAAFIGEDPNGIWTLTIADDSPGASGTSNGWELDITTAGPPLPVELTAFEALASDGFVTLHWTTATETDNAGFEVQHAIQTNTAPRWQTLAFVPGVGTTLEPQTYMFRAEGLTPGRHFFRLKQVDFDGAFTYSPEVEAGIDLPSTHLLSAAYPNPFNPSTTFTLTLAREQHIALEVFDVTGKPVALLHNGLLSANTQHQFRFEAGLLPGGLYFYRVTGEAFTDTRPMTLLK